MSPVRCRGRLQPAYRSAKCKVNGNYMLRLYQANKGLRHAGSSCVSQHKPYQSIHTPDHNTCSLQASERRSHTHRSHTCPPHTNTCTYLFHERKGLIDLADTAVQPSGYPSLVRSSRSRVDDLSPNRVLHFLLYTSRGNASVHRTSDFSKSGSSFAGSATLGCLMRNMPADRRCAGQRAFCCHRGTLPQPCH